ncbi:MAG: aldo/keto reductase [Desulfobacterales bacterium]
MKEEKDKGMLDRREFIKWSVMMAMSGKALVADAAAKSGGKSSADSLIHRNERPTMTYHQLGRTHFMSSRLVFGGGAALSGGKGVRLLDRAFEAGINHFDLGSNIYYKGAERHFAPFMKAHRKDIWVISKAFVGIQAKPDEEITVGVAKQGAAFWTNLLEESLKDLNTDYMDAYYLMGVNNPSVVRSEEIYNAFLKAKKAGKVGHLGVSTHENAANVLEAMIETGWYDIAMVGITPAGWYDWIKKDLVKDSPPLVDLAPRLKRAEKAGIGLVGMKTTRHLSLQKALFKKETDIFDHFYGRKLMAAPFNPYQRAYAYALENGIHVVNSDMQNFKHLEENITATATGSRYFA